MGKWRRSAPSVPQTTANGIFYSNKVIKLWNVIIFSVLSVVSSFVALEFCFLCAPRYRLLWYIIETYKFIFLFCLFGFGWLAHTIPPLFWIIQPFYLFIISRVFNIADDVSIENLFHHPFSSQLAWIKNYILYFLQQPLTRVKARRDSKVIYILGYHATFDLNRLEVFERFPSNSTKCLRSGLIESSLPPELQQFHILSDEI